MKPSAFDYFDPKSVTEALKLLERYGDEGKLLAGGQSLVPMMNFRVARPKVLIDINGIKALQYIREMGKTLAIGALTRESELEASPVVRGRCPILAKAVSYIGHAPVRTRGTIGGSLAHADPSAEIPTVICALNGQMKVVGRSARKTLGPEEFFLTYLTSGLDPSEILVEVRVPTLPPGTGWSFMELSRRHGDFAIVAVAAVLFKGKGKACKEARIALGGVAPTPIRAAEAEAVLAGQKVTDSLIREAAQKAAAATEPESDYHASAEYRREMARVFTQRALSEAWTMVKGGK